MVQQPLLGDPLKKKNSVWGEFRSRFVINQSVTTALMFELFCVGVVVGED
jgi:hypothetical protein